MQEEINPLATTKPAAPVTYQIVKQTYHYMGAIPEPQPAFVREKSSVEGGYYGSLHVHEQTADATLAELLTKIVQALEQLGLELVTIPAQDPQAFFRKKAEPVSPLSSGREFHD